MHSFKPKYIVLLQCNAQKIAEYLSSHPRVKKVNYAGLLGHPGRDLHFSQVGKNTQVLPTETKERY